MSDIYAEDEDTNWLCAACIREPYLCQKVEDEGKQATCSYCGNEGQSFTIEQIADLVEVAFEQHYTRTPAKPNSWQEAMIRDKETD
jgi:NMD protein affecting ribosome stability and mRNA decay